MSKKLAAKNALIEMPALKPSTQTNVSVPARPRTAVGGMAQFVTTQSPLHQEVEDLRMVVAMFDGAHIVKALPAGLVVPSQWANRHETSFYASDFADLKREIQDAGGNVQPIKVRPLKDLKAGEEGEARYEIIFGHRRHRACLELDLPVNALVEEVDDQRLFEQMERENRGRKNLSPWEQGTMYLSALERGLYPSQRKLAEAIGVDLSLISKSVTLAKLPKEVITAFPTPLDVQFRWAQRLGDAFRRDPDGTVRKAEELTALRAASPLSAAQVLARLTADLLAGVPEPKSGRLTVGKKRVGEWTVDSNGVVNIKLVSGALAVPALKELLNLLQGFLEKQ